MLEELGLSGVTGRLCARYHAKTMGLLFLSSRGHCAGIKGMEAYLCSRTFACLCRCYELM